MIVSQAIYCLEPVQSRIRPVGNGLILIPSRLIVPRLLDPIIPPPTGQVRHILTGQKLP